MNSKPILDQTLQLVMNKHAGQYYNDEPYVFHLIRVASQVDGYEKKTIALLHDVLEDTNTSIRELIELGYSYNIVCGVTILTHYPVLPYLDYIANICKFNFLAEIKMADMLDNFLHISKIKSQSRRIKLLAKYIPAWNMLQSSVSL